MKTEELSNTLEDFVRWRNDKVKLTLKEDADEYAAMIIPEPKLHQCKYCKVMVSSESDEGCYANPNK